MKRVRGRDIQGDDNRIGTLVEFLSDTTPPIINMIRVWGRGIKGDDNLIVRDS
jgi:hypothetical protein